MDARLVGIRWDLVGWGLVFDFDKPVSEEKNSPMCRAWVVFDGVSEICFPFENSRLPNGCFFTSGFSSVELPKKFFKFSASVLLPSYDSDDQCLEPVAKEISVKAKSMFGIRSICKAEADTNFGWLTHESRNKLVGDDDMLEVLYENRGQIPIKL